MEKIRISFKNSSPAEFTQRLPLQYFLGNSGEGEQYRAGSFLRHPPAYQPNDFGVVRKWKKEIRW